MSKLTNIPIINQEELLESYKFAIQESENILVFGPSGAGKTDMSYQACDALGKNLIYWNMSVMERPDIQGIPAVSKDRQTASFAPNEEMPFVGIKAIKERRSLNQIIDAIKEGDDELGDFLKESKTQLNKVNRSLAVSAIKECAHLFNDELLSSAAIKRSLVGNETSNNVLLLDEIDKTPPENLQPLLQLLLYKSINSRPLDIQSVIMTGNLPDEMAYSEPLSHALTNRAMIFELKPLSRIWVKWGIKMNLHPLVLGFMSRDEMAVEFFNKRPKNNEMYSYAYSTPRAWAKASRVLYKYERLEKESPEGFSNIFKESFRDRMLASIVGTAAANKFKVWVKYYRQYDSLIDSVFSGKNENPPDEVDARIVCAIAVANKFSFFARNCEEPEKVQQKASHVFNWIKKNNTADVAQCSFRASFDMDTFMKHGLDEFEDTAKIWSEIVETQEALNNPEQKL